ncbi:MAG: phosphatase PAP2 family protein [Xanthobacteraceae bacterium]|nr:phosphatase PAP2 family protein [Xanthobacteraceae bacterium]
MTAPARLAEASSYPARLVGTLGEAWRRLTRTPSHSRRAAAARRAARHVLIVTALAAVAIVALMFMLDARVIQLMPPRGAARLWPVRLISDFGKSEYVLWTLLAALAITALTLPRLRGRMRAILIGWGDRVLFLFIAVAVPVLAGDVLKGVIGRGRPFVGGHANPFNYSHFAWTEAYASLPSGHAMTSAALAFAAASLWPRLRWWMAGYVIAILATRLVLLAHHPSDVVAGALVGVVGAMAVRNWFAARRLVFTIAADGTVSALPGPSAADLKKVARAAFAPYEAPSAKRL